MYIIGDARNLSEHCPEKAAVVCADLAWARPNRGPNYALYPTYDTENGIWEFVDEIYETLEPGGWALFDADDWFLPRLINYLRETWGDVAATYEGGGYRRVGTVVWDRRGGGHYFTNGGYHVVFAHKGETDRESDVPAKQTAAVPPDWIDWGTPKPIGPYRRWIDSITNSQDLVAVPCAGTAPAAIAVEQLYGSNAKFIAVDSEPDAKEEYEKRRRRQGSLADSAGETDW